MEQRMDITRRTATGGLAGATIGLIGGRALAQAPAATGAKGPAVWLDLDQKALDDAYDQSAYAPNLLQITGRYASNSEAVRARLGAPQRHAYGASAIEALDLYPTAQTNAPIQIFLHGGAWRVGLAKEYAFPAETFVRAGAHFVVPDFINVIESGGDLIVMAEQVRRAIAWVDKNARSFGGDPDRIYLTGHSSGAHLGGAALIADWRHSFDLPQDVIKGALLCSGMYDLQPVRLSARSRYVKFTDAAEAALSTQRHLERIACPVVLAYGTLETPEFQRQTRDFAAALEAAHKPVRLLVGEGYNHFEIAETLANPYGLLGRAALAQMGLGTA
jgi:arylformamidase